MKNLFLITFIFIACYASIPVYAQDDLLELLEKEAQDDQQVNYAFATFKATRIINGQSVENTSGGELSFIIAHRFGQINDGFYQLFGLDQSTIRFGFEYGITDRLNIGLGRSSFQKTFDAYAKYKLIRQSTGLKNVPVTVSLFTNVSAVGLKDINANNKDLFSSRFAYTHQVLIARKFNNSFSFQLSPTVVHKNLVATEQDENDIYALGFGTRYKLSNRVSLNLEYFYRFNVDNLQSNRFNAVAIGFDIETGGHIFQLHLTNSQGMAERYFVAETTGEFLDGDIYFGFNVNRVFKIKGKE